MNATKTPSDYLVKGMEKIQPAYAQFEGKMYAGLIPSSHGGRFGEMMFWLFKPHEQSVENTLTLWLNGGPGCSSFNCGVMMENSPVTQPLHDAGYCCLQPTPDLSYNNHSWTRATTMLYVEQPIGTGFSRGHPLPENEHDVASDLYEFMQNFYSVFTELSTYEFFVMGESYAGMFVPAITRYFHLQNKKKDRPIIPIGGASIGNGWMDAYIQGPATIDYSWWHGLIDEPTRNALHAEWHHCMEEREKRANLESPPFHPFNVQDDCGMMWGVLEAAGNPNAYDITTWDPNVDQITFTTEVFFNRPEVKKALNVPDDIGITWHGCRWGEGRRQLSAESSSRRLGYMDNDRPVNMAPYVADILDAGIPFLVYNGDRDMTTNMVGQEKALNGMEWSGQHEWLDAPRGLWMTDDYESGWAKEYKGLSFVVVYNSGHMVPYNQPGPAFDLVERFLRHETFIDTELPQLRFKSDKMVTLTMTDNIFSTSSINHVNRGTESVAVVALVSFLVGIVSTLLFMRGTRHAGYQRVP